MGARRLAACFVRSARHSMGGGRGIPILYDLMFFTRGVRR
jgi:hypothetical protein